MSSFPCPYCATAKFTTVRKAYYARGFLLAYQHGEKLFIGCEPCVASELRMEAGRSLLYGWFSVTALIINVFLIPINFGRSFIVQPDPDAVRKFLKDARIPEETDEFRIVDAFYVLAAALIKADGKIDNVEIETACKAGGQILSDFDEDQFQSYLEGVESTASIDDLGHLLRDYLEDSEKNLLLEYLITIAKADGDFSSEEREMIERTATNLGLEQENVKTIEQNLS